MPSRHTNTAAMIECALCVALSYVMTKINLFTMPQGGSVDFELVPLILFTYRRGWNWGLAAGTLAGVSAADKSWEDGGVTAVQLAR